MSAFFGRNLSIITGPMVRKDSLRRDDYQQLFLATIGTVNNEMSVILPWLELNETHGVLKIEADSPEAIDRMKYTQSLIVNGYIRELCIKYRIKFIGSLVNISITYYSSTITLML